MKFQVVTGRVAAPKVPCLVWVVEGGSGLDGASGGASLKQAAGRLVKEGRFKGKLRETFLLPLDSKWFLLVGLGKKKDLTLDHLRHAAATGVLCAVGAGMEALSVALPAAFSDKPEVAAQAITEGMVLGGYRFQECKAKSLSSDDRRTIKTITWVADKASQKKAVEAGIKTGQTIAEAVCWARDLGNRPANSLTPTKLAEEAKATGKRFGFQVQALDPQQMKSKGMNAVLAVAQGSREPARFLIAEYSGTKPSAKPLVLIGKGITFDSGGISIKPSSKMEEMKFDMCGAAAVLGAVRAIAALKLPLRVVGLVPATENLPGGSAQRPGDVIRAHSGKTIEVINTDAEGRLVLADALSFADQYKPAAIIDLATLTGACVVALGVHAAGLMGNHASLAKELKTAGERSGERTWELPLWPEYSEAIRSTVADIKNTGDGKAGTITGGAFLKEFVKEGTPWVHLDIAGVAWADGTKGYLTKGGTGTGVRLLVEFARNWKPTTSSS